MAGDLFIRIDDDKNLPFLASSEKSGEIRLSPHLQGQHRGYFHLVMEEGDGNYSVLLKEDIIIPEPAHSRDLTFRIFRKKGRHLLLEVLRADQIILTRKISLPPRKLRVLTVAGLIPLLFLAFPLLMSQRPEPIPSEQNAVSPRPVSVEQTAPDPPPDQAFSQTLEVVIGDSPDRVTQLNGPDSTGTETSEMNSSPGFGVHAETEKSPGKEVIATSAAAPERQGVLFLADSPELTGLAKELLNRIPLRENNRTLTLLQVRGHCALWGSEAGRQKLSVERAEAVANYLAERGARLLPETIIEGLGATEPVTRDPDNQEINRRVEILLTYR